TRATYPRGHVLHADQFERASAEGENVARFEPRNERLLDRADPSARQISDIQRSVGDDRADVVAMPAHQVLARHTVQSVAFAHYAVIVRIGAQRGAAAFDKTERPIELRLRQLPVRVSAANFSVQFARV